MSFVKISIHAVWGTKYREPILTKEIRTKLFEHIRQNAKVKGIYIDSINGYTDHVHCLLGLNADMSIAKAIQLIKGESAFWANKNKLLKTRFEWAEDYYAASVSDSVVQKVREYILKQEEHHSKMTFTEEFERFIEKHEDLVRAKAL